MLLALAGLLIAFASPPEAPRVELTWRAAAGCPDAGAIHRRLRELVPAPAPGPVVRVEADAKRSGAGWRMRLVLRGPQLDDRRAIEARDCHSLADVTALLIALAVAPADVVARIASGTDAAPRGPAGSPAPAPSAGLPGPSTAPDASARPTSAADVPGLPVPSVDAPGSPAASGDASTRAGPPPPGAPGFPAMPADTPTRAGAPPTGAPGFPAAPADAPTRAGAPPTGAPGFPATPADTPTRAGAPPTGAPGFPTTPADTPTRAGAPPTGAPATPADTPTRAGAPPKGAPGLPASLADDPALDAPASTSAARPAAPVPPLRAAVRLAGGAEIGGIPAYSPVAGLVLGLFRGAWRVELAGTYAARAVTYPEPAAIGARMLVAAGAVRGCGVPRWRRLEFPVCGGLELGYVRAVACGVADPRPAGDLWIAAQLSPGLAWAPTRVLAVSLGLDILLALRRPGFHVAGLGELARAQPVGLRPMLGIEARFP